MLPEKRVYNFLHPKEHGLFPDRWNCRTLTKRYCLDARKMSRSYEMLSLRGWKQILTSSQEYHFENDVPNRSPVQKRLSIYNWNPGPRRGREGAIEKQIAGKWHIITLQEAIEKVDHGLLTNRFHVTHYGGCAVLFSWDTFLPDIKVKSIHLDDVRHDLPDKVFDGESGWVIQGVISRASFRWQPLD